MPIYLTLHVHGAAVNASGSLGVVTEEHGIKIIFNVLTKQELRFSSDAVFGNKTVKLAISGKGGVGKSTLAAALSLLIARQGRTVLAVDADPDANLAAALGISAAEQQAIIPIAERKQLIEERTGAKVSQYGQVFKINPEVSDIAENYAYHHDGVALLVLGAVERAGGGCACPESILLRALVSDLVLYKKDALILDMEAGVEHLGRATARGVECMLVVVEPGQRSVDCGRRVREMAGELGIKNVRAVANKVTSAADEQFIREALGELPLIGSIPYSEAFRQSDRDGHSVLDGLDEEIVRRFSHILEQLDGSAS